MFYLKLYKQINLIIINGIDKIVPSYSEALARETRAAEHHGEKNVVNYPSEKIW